MAEASHGYHDIPWTRLSGSSGLLLEIPRDLTASGQDSQDNHHTKSICSRHGIPEEIVSDNMSFGIREFKDFVHVWGIKTTTSSPTYAQSNGQAERFVQTLKGLLKKADEEGRDPYIALLEYRNTQISGLQYTPSQMLMSRLLRSKLPTKQSLLQPKVVQAHDDLTRRQQR